MGIKQTTWQCTQCKGQEVQIMSRNAEKVIWGSSTWFWVLRGYSGRLEGQDFDGSSCTPGRGEAGTWHLPALKMWAKGQRKGNIWDGGERCGGEGSLHHMVESSGWQLAELRLSHQAGTIQPKAFLETGISGISVSNLAHLQTLLWQWPDGESQ